MGRHEGEHTPDRSEQSSVLDLPWSITNANFDRRRWQPAGGSQKASRQIRIPRGDNTAEWEIQGRDKVEGSSPKGEVCWLKLIVIKKSLFGEMSGCE